MTTSDALGDYPFDGDEETNLLGELNRIRGTFIWKCSGLDAAGMRTTLGPSAITLGGLVMHLTYVEQTKFTWLVRGADPGAPWNEDHDDPDWEWAEAARHSPEELIATWRTAVATSQAAVREAVAGGGLGAAPAIAPGGERANLRRLIIDVIEEYARHTGHADLIRESVDGLVGEDPPR